MTLDLETFKKMSKKERDAHGKNLPEGFTYDKYGNVLTFKNSHGYWYEYTYDENGKELAYKNSDGADVEYFLWGKNYNLGYDKNAKKYHAGCQTLTYKQCEKFYKNYKYVYKESHDIIKAIREHHINLTSREEYVKFHNKRAETILTTQKKKCEELLLEMGRGDETFETTSGAIRQEALYLALKVVPHDDWSVWQACQDFNNKINTAMKLDDINWNLK